MEFGIDDIGRLRGHMTGRDPVGALEVAGVEQASADNALLDPPFARIDEHPSVPWHTGKQLGRFLVLLLFAQGLDLNVELGGILAPGRIDRRDQRICLVVAAADCCPGTIERLRLAEIAKAFGLFDAIAVEEHGHAPLMIGGC